MPIVLIVAAVLILGAGLFLLIPSKEKSQVESSGVNAPTPNDQLGDIARNAFKNVFEEVFNKPGPNKRVCGYLIDLLIISIVELFVRSVFKLSFHWSILVVYWLLRDSLVGQSVGKRIVGLQTVNEKGKAATPVEGIMRNITIAIPFVSIIEYFVMLRNGEGKRIGDLIAHTKVTDLRPKQSDRIFLWISILVFLVTILLLRQGTSVFNQSSIREQGAYSGTSKKINSSASVDEFNKKDSEYIVGPQGPFEDVSFDNEIYSLAYFVPKNPLTSGYMKEYIRKGESLDSWSRLVAVNHLPENADALQVAQTVGELVQESNPGTKYQIIKNDATGEVIIDFIIWNGAPEQVKKYVRKGEDIEFSIVRYVPAPDFGGLLQYQFSYRSNNAGVFKESLLNNREQWINSMIKFLY
ncbi:MAG: RDD family protein [Candidatus Omnitrophica bacterium]|nr:RDD family protein [Candidatus Omnitrophota bacterium]